MASLSDTERREVVQRLACFETPAEVVEWASEDLNKDLTIQQVCHYDPTRSGGTGERWRTLFKETREEFLNDLDTIALSHRAVRLEKLTRYVRKLEREERYDDAAKLLKQAAKEVGEKFTNVERKEHSGPGGEPLKMHFVDPTEVEVNEDA